MRRGPALLLVAVTLAIGYFGLLPLGTVFLRALSAPDVGPLIAKVVSSPANQRALMMTVVTAAGTALFALVGGCVLGFLVGGTDVPMRSIFAPLLSLPYVVPAYITALAWIILAAEKTGWLNQLFEQGLGIAAPWNVYSTAGLIAVMGITLSPLVVTSVAETVSRTDYSVVEAARIAGASPGRALRDAVWPLIAPAACAAALLVFLAAAASYGVPALIGPSARPPVTVLTTRIKAMIDLHTARGFTQAILMCSFLFTLSFLFPLAERWGLSSRQTGSSRSIRAFRYPLGALRGPAAALVALWVVVAVILPFTTILISSFMRSAGGGLAIANLSLVHWQAVLGRDESIAALKNSVLLAAGAATASMLIGGLLAYAESRSDARWKGIPGTLISIPYATPGTVLAIGLILAFTGRFGLNLFSSMWILLIAYTVKEMALAYRMARVALSQIHPSLEEAARISGATRLQAFRDVIWPLIAGPLGAAWLLVFMPSFGELTMSILLFGPETQTIGTLLFDLLSYEDPAAAAVVAVLLLVVVGTIQMWIQTRLARGRRAG